MSNYNVQKIKKYRYTGPNFDNVKTGEIHSTRGWGNKIKFTPSGINYRITRHHQRVVVGDTISQNWFNRIINDSMPDVLEDDLIPVDFVDVKIDLRTSKNRIITILKKYPEYSNEEIAESSKSTKEYVSALRRELYGYVNKTSTGNIKNSHIEKKVKCKCPRCGGVYYRRGYYTGSGVWRKNHDKGKCDANYSDDVGFVDYSINV